jgi:hypothetical protein
MKKLYVKTGIGPEACRRVYPRAHPISTARICAGALNILPPEIVTDIGHGNPAAGRKVLQKFVTMIRKQKAA